MISRRLAGILFLFIIVISGCNSAPKVSNEIDLSEFKPMPPPEDLPKLSKNKGDLK